jgi:hypothetical protein
MFGEFTKSLQYLPNIWIYSQTLLLWEYTAKIGMLPFRDIFYPYGLLSYYQTQNIFFVVGYLLIAPLLFFIIFLAFKRLFANYFYAFIAISFFYFFIISITGFETFTRYGILIAFAIALAIYYVSSKIHSKKWLTILGLSAGLLFSFIVDVGFYAPVLFVLFSLSNSLIKYEHNNPANQAAKVLKEILYFIIGFCVGLIPFIFYLSVTRSFFPFFSYLKNLHDIALYAKTPFIHSVSSIDNLFVLILLLMGISYLSFIFIWKKQRATFNNFFQLGVVFTLILLEQKSIIRSIDTQLTFIGFLLFLTLFADLKHYFEKCKFHQVAIFLYFIAILSIILFSLGLRPLSTFSDNYPSIKKNVLALNNFTNQVCITNNVQYLLTKDKRYMQIEKKIRSILQFNGKIFVFPGDPLFYILFNQRPPFYPSIYEATPVYAQKEFIAYIKENKIQIIIYNTNIKSIQDGVPDILRGRVVYQFIRANYHVVDSQGGFLILEKNSKK